MELITYIIKYKTKNDITMYYLGCTNNLLRRLEQHMKGINTQHCKKILGYIYFKGNYEKRLKFFSKKFLYELITTKLVVSETKCSE